MICSIEMHLCCMKDTALKLEVVNATLPLIYMYN